MSQMDEETKGNVILDGNSTRRRFKTGLWEQHSNDTFDIDEASIENGNTIIEELDSDQFLIENFSFSLTSIDPKPVTPEEYCCRICQEENFSEPNISPCQCRGTMGWIHRSCLEQWLVASDSENCEICGFRFNVRRQPKYNILKALTVWLTMEESRRERLSIVSDSIGFITAFPLILLANHQSITMLEIFRLDEIDAANIFIPFLKPNSVVNEIFQASSQLATFIIMGAVSFLDVFYFSWLFLRVHRHFFKWYKWYRSQCKVHLILPENE